MAIATNSSIIVTLCLHFFMISEQVGSSEYLNLKSLELYNGKIDDMLEEFFAGFNKVYLQTHAPRHITIVDASINDLLQIQLLIKSYPSIICTMSNECDYQNQFSRGNFVIVFFRELSLNAYRRNIKVLSLCEKCNILFVSNGTVPLGDIRYIFDLAIQGNLPYAQLMHIDKNVIRLYNYNFAPNCSVEVKLDGVWRPGDGSNIIGIWAYSVYNLNGCAITVSSLIFTPKLLINEETSGSLTIVGGREGFLLLELSKILNFTISLKFPSMEDRMKYSRKDAILHDVLSGKAEMGIGRLRATSSQYEIFDLSNAYDEECITWGVPRILSVSNEIVTVEFTSEVWAAVALVFAVGCVISCVCRYITLNRNGMRKDVTFSTIFFDLVGINLGGSAILVPPSPGGKFFLLTYLYYAIVITTAYKTSLASIITANEATPLIVDAQAILNANLSIGGAHYDYNILKDQANDNELNIQLLERFVINNNDSESWDQLQFHHNYAYLTRRSSLNYFRQKKKSMLRKPVDKIIRLFAEAGILKYWDLNGIDVDDVIARKNAEGFFENRAAYKFRNIFVLYFGCIVLCIVTFVLELLSRTLGSIKRQLDAHSSPWNSELYH